jgi:hypothetical protein
MALLDKFQKEGTVLTPLRGTKPTSTLVRDVIPINKTFSQGQYQDYVLNTKGSTELQRSRDLTGNP